MSHYSTCPRKAYIILHHTGSPNSHTVFDDRFCDSGYDFTIDRNGRIYVCINPVGNPRWTSSNVAHARGCNCTTVGIAVHGCFGGCTSGNISSLNAAQICAVGFLWAHLGTAASTSRLRPHRHCFYWQPCGTGTSTVCCGTNYTAASSSNHSFNSAGVTLRQTILARRNSWISNGCCNPATDPC